MSCLPPFTPVNMEFHIFLCTLFLSKVLLLIKQQREFEGILLLEGVRKRPFWWLCISKVHLISTPPSLLRAEAGAWSVVRTGGSGFTRVIHTFVRDLWPRRRDRQKSNSSNYVCRGCSIQTRKLCGMPCCGKSILYSQEQLKVCVYLLQGNDEWADADLIRMPGEEEHPKYHVMT